MGRKDKYYSSPQEPQEPEAASTEAAPEAPLDVEHAPAAIIWHSFDAFFNDYCNKNKINPKWKVAVKLHLKSLGCLNDQSKWLDGLKHFGI